MVLRNIFVDISALGNWQVVGVGVGESLATGMSSEGINKRGVGRHERILSIPR